MFTAYVKHPERIGGGFDVFSSSINHSCAPNAHDFFGRRELRVRSLRSIRPDEEIQNRTWKTPTTMFSGNIVLGRNISLSVNAGKPKIMSYRNSKTNFLFVVLILHQLTYRQARASPGTKCQEDASHRHEFCTRVSISFYTTPSPSNCTLRMLELQSMWNENHPWYARTLSQMKFSRCRVNQC